MVEELDRAVEAVVRDCLGVEAGEEVLVICNPVTEDLGALMRIVAQGEGAEATLAVMSERDSHAAEPPAAGRGGDARRRRRDRADDPVALPHRRAQGARARPASGSPRCPASPRRCSPG